MLLPITFQLLRFCVPAGQFPSSARSPVKPPLRDENTDASSASVRQTAKPVARVSDVRSSTQFSNDLSGDEIGLKSTGEG